MDNDTQAPSKNRWWLVALLVSLVSVSLVFLLVQFPTSGVVWFLAAVTIVFAVVLYFNPRFRYWRRASWCFGIAGLLAFVPTLTIVVKSEELGTFKLISDSSPFVVFAFLGAGLVLAWLDARTSGVSTISKRTIKSDISVEQVSHSPNAISGLSAGRDIVFNQGVSEEALKLSLDNTSQLIELVSQQQPKHRKETADATLLWRLVDDIKKAKREMEEDTGKQLVAQLDELFRDSGEVWPEELRKEALLLLAEHERASIALARSQDLPYDMSRFRQLLMELQDVGA